MQKEQQSDLKYLISTLSKTTLWIIAIILLVIFILIFGAWWLNRNNHITIGQNDKISLSPTQVRSIENIGEWEFLSISDEELIDTTRHGFFGNDHLVRIYYGTMRLGIDLSDARPGWLKAKGDSIVAILPPIKLLDKNFIDEARTKPFYEEGTWDHATRQALYEKAYNAMYHRCMTRENIKNAQRNAKDQFESMLKSMGFENVSIKFRKTKIDE